MKSKKAHSYHQPRSADEDYSLRLETVLAQICAGRSPSVAASLAADTARPPRITPLPAAPAPAGSLCSPPPAPQPLRDAGGADAGLERVRQETLAGAGPPREVAGSHHGPALRSLSPPFPCRQQDPRGHGAVPHRPARSGAFPGTLLPGIPPCRGCRWHLRVRAQLRGQRL